MAFNRPYLEKVHKECLDLGERKSNDYSSVADGIEICGIRGISTRLVDKVLRIASLTSPGVSSQVKSESIRDTLLDVINYATYGVALFDGQWGLDGVQIRKDDQWPTSVIENRKKGQLAYNRLASQLALEIDKDMMKECTKINIRKPKWKPSTKLKKKLQKSKPKKK